MKSIRVYDQKHKQEKKKKDIISFNVRPSAIIRSLQWTKPFNQAIIEKTILDILKITNVYF